MDWNQFATDDFFCRMARRADHSDEWLRLSGEALERAMKQKREALSLALGLDTLRAMAGDFAPPTLLEQRRHNELTVSIYSAQLLPALQIPLYVLEPARPRRNARGVETILYAQPHGNMFTESLMKQREGEPLACADTFEIKLALRGYRVVMPELMGFGALVKRNYRDDKDRGCYANSLSLLLHGMSMAGVRVYTCLRALDFALDIRDAGDVIGYGMSGGGLIMTLLAALRPKLKAAAIASYQNHYAASIEAMHHCVDNYLPGAYAVGDAPLLASLAAPLPLLLSGGKADPIFPVAATEDAFRFIRALYKAYGAPDAVETELFEGAHEISERVIFDWLEARFT